MGLKVLVSGQTVGPVLTDADRTEVTEALNLCHLVGSRERHTQDLLSSLGIDSLPVLDDATFFSPGVEDERTDGIPSSYIAATFAPASGAMPRKEYHRHMARLLDLAYEHLQLPILLLPHVSTFGESDGDQDCHAAIARLSKAPNILVLDQKQAGETAALTAAAELIITSRYHPVIFGLSAGVPILPVAVDYYGEVRIGGALENWGLRPLLRSLRHLGDGADVIWVNSVLNARSEITTHLQLHGQKLRTFHDNWWETIDAALRGYPAEEEFSTIPVPDTGVSLVLEQAESSAASRLNASNEIAIGNLAQHSDWLQGQLDERVRQSDPAWGFASASWGSQGFLIPSAFRAAERLAKRARPLVRR
jgi:polysaccharide pyruvyl transferase WcaK-like protein